MTGPSKRRLETAKRIQAAAIRLADRDGMSNVTTEAIARESGVSPRTFFNYYPYKEAAIYGPPKDYPREASDAFVVANGRLIDDLSKLMQAHLSRFTDQRDQVAAVIRLAATDAKLAALQQTALLERHSVMEQMLRQRLTDHDPRFAPILAAAIISATRHAVLDWVEGRTDDLVGQAIENIGMIEAAGNILMRKG
ncbi:TetR/AcrR family transcriptional regulator [Paracoccus sp. M683]|uniref:TetR/AcrR family transcriptional regulator n=1 Tax=Paracoccus sp. M683 TaxID=2594268 RepID=UPI00163D7A5B|nr:TetR/AcrR family transcriptional regulator [Paracoccus sp. M683]